MALKTTDKEFDRIFGDGGTVTEIFVKKLMKYLKTQPQRTPYSDILNCIEKGEKLSCFSCRYDLAEPLLYNLIKDGIPCILVLAPNGRSGFITPADSNKAVVMSEKHTLAEKAVTVNRMTGEEMLENNETVIVVSGLSLSEAYLVADEIRRGQVDHSFAIGAKDGKYAITYNSRSALKRGKNGMTVAQYIVKAQLLASGVLKDVLSERADNRLRIEKLFGKGNKAVTDNGGKPVYLIGSGNQYLKMTLEGFSFGTVKQYDGNTDFIEAVSLGNTDVTYNKMLLSYIGRLVNPYVAYNPYELDAAVRASGKIIDIDAMRENVAIDNVLSATAELIESRKELSSIFSQAKNEDLKVSEEVRQTMSVLVGTATDEYSYEFSATDIAGIRDTMIENGFSAEDYINAMSSFSAPQITLNQQEIKLIDDIHEFRAEYWERLKAEQARNEKSLFR